MDSDRMDSNMAKAPIPIPTRILIQVGGNLARSTVAVITPIVTQE
jgi:hypothetical protein